MTTPYTHGGHPIDLGELRALYTEVMAEDTMMYLRDKTPTSLDIRVEWGEERHLLPAEGGNRSVMSLFHAIAHAPQLILDLLVED